MGDFKRKPFGGSFQKNMVNKETDFIFGIHPIIEALKAGENIDKVLIKKELKGESSKELMSLLHSNRITSQYVPEQKLNQITRKNHQGVIALTSPIPFHNLGDVITQTYEDGKTPLLIVLDGVTDVRNFGAIVRTAECAGATAVVIPSRGAARISSDAVKTSAGAIYHLPICKESSLVNALDYLKKSGIQVLAATEKANENYSGVDLSVPTAFVMGAEGDGISRDLLREADREVSLPILGEVGSLNVSVAAGVLIYETIRQRL
ncbi:MAG: 23S rRNA (guanosine(2251)-2'-O)-methyltransferase RlmB [Bacteroidales bacterium]